MLKTIRRTRRSFWNLQRMLGTVIMILEFLTGRWKRGSKKLGNKVIGRSVVRRVFLR